MKKIFLSYRRVDSQSTTERIHDRLVQAFGSDNVFLDVDDDILPGQHWAQILKKELDAAEILLVIIGQNWERIINEKIAQEDYVRFEVEEALKQGDDMLVVPVLVNDATVPRKVPDSMVDLLERQIYRVRGNPDFHRDMDKLIAILHPNIAPKKTGLPIAAWGGVGIFGALLIFVLAFMFLRPNDIDVNATQTAMAAAQQTDDNGQSVAIAQATANALQATADMLRAQNEAQAAESTLQAASTQTALAIANDANQNATATQAARATDDALGRLTAEALSTSIQLGRNQTATASVLATANALATDDALGRLTAEALATSIQLGRNQTATASVLATANALATDTASGRLTAEALATVIQFARNLTATAAANLDFGGGSGRIIFTGYEEHNGNTRNLYIVNLDTPETWRRITNYPTGQRADFAMYSPDASKILYELEAGGHVDLYAMDASGSTPVNLTSSFSDNARIAEWSPDGTKIVFYTTKSDGSDDIWVMNANGTNFVNLTNSRASDRLPTWSPDGSQIAFSSNRGGGAYEIYVMNADGSNVRALTSNGGQYSITPSWSPTGEWIAYHYWAGVGTDIDIYLVSPINGQNRILVDNTVNDYAPGWSPNGQYVIYHRDSGPIRIVDLSGREVVTIVNTFGVPAGANWRP